MLLFIARQGRTRMPQASKRPPNAPLGPCNTCGGVNHWARECPFPQQSRPNQANLVVLALARHCLECGIKYLVINCPLNPYKKGKAPLSSIDVIPSLNTMPTLSGEESEGMKPVNVVTQAQARDNLMTNKETQTERSSRNTWKPRR